MDKRKQSMRPPDAALLRKQSMYPGKQLHDGKDGLTLEVPVHPGQAGRRGSIDSRGRRPSIMSFDMGHTLGRRKSLAGSMLGRQENHSAKERQVKYENTYRLEPDQAFAVAKVREISLDILESHLKGLPYDNEECPKLSKTLADTIKQQVKAVGNPRYKIVVIVAIGQVMETLPSVCFTSRCIWNDKLDNFVETTYKNKKLYAVALVYGVYAD